MRAQTFLLLLPLLVMMSEVRAFTVVTRESLEVAVARVKNRDCIGEDCPKVTPMTLPPVFAKKQKSSEIRDLKYLDNKYNRANNLMENKEYLKAIELFDEYLEESLEILGTEHIDRLRAMFYKSSCLNYLGRYLEALELENQTLEIMYRTLNEHDNDLIDVMNKKVITLVKLERYQEALDLITTVLDKQHENEAFLLIDMHNKAYILSKLGRFQEAVDLYDEVIEKRTNLLGPDDAETLHSMEYKAGVLESLGDVDGAVELYQKVLEKRRKIWGEEDEGTKKTKANLDRVKEELLNDV